MFALRGNGDKVFVSLLVVQGVHELEHVVQVIQRYLLNIPNRNGVVGSIADIEPVHFVYSTLYLVLLAVAFVRLPEEWRMYGRSALTLLVAALVVQTWHEFEHIAKLVQYFVLHTNGTGGILGIGPGALRPTFAIPLLHLAYNTLAYAPALGAYLLIRRSGRVVAAAAA